MFLEDSFSVDAGVDQVWAFLQDIPRLCACIPGVEQVTEIDPDTYQGVLKVKVGPLSAKFSGQVRIVEREAMKRMVALVEGEDKASASFAKATFTGRLSAQGKRTRLEYETEISLRGRLAQFGLTVIRGTVKNMTREFVQNTQEALNS